MSVKDYSITTYNNKSNHDKIPFNILFQTHDATVRSMEI